MLYSPWRRSPRRASNYLQLFITALLIFSLCLALASPDARVAAQGECIVGSAATVPATAQAGAAVPFASTTTATGCASAVSYEWDFGDGTPHSSDQNTTHTYAAPGTYTWRVTASANTGVTAIDTIAGGYGEGALVKQAPFTTPVAIARDPQGRGLYVSDQAAIGSFVRFVNTGNAAVTIAGRSIAPGASRVLLSDGGFSGFQSVFDRPATELAITAAGLVASADGNLLYISDAAGSTIWAFNVSGSARTVFGESLQPGNVTTLARGAGLSGIAVHPQTGEVYFTDNNLIHKITGFEQTAVVAGNGAATQPSQTFPNEPTTATAVPLLAPRDIAFDAAGNLYITDTGHARIVKLDAGGKLSLVRQLALEPINPFPAGLAAIGDKVYVANGNSQTIMQLTGAGAINIGASGTACDYTLSNCGDGRPIAEALFNLQGSTATSALVGLDADANGLFILDQGSAGRGRVRYLNLGAQPVALAGTTVAAGSIDTIAGNGLIAPFDDGLAVSSVLSNATGVAADAQGNLWIADTFRAAIRFVNRGKAAVTLFAGTRAETIVQPGQIVTVNKDVGPGQTDNTLVNQASFDTPQGLFVTDKGVFVADSKRGPAVNSKRTGLVRFINTSNATVSFFTGPSAAVSVPPGFVGSIAGGGVNGNGNGDGGSASAAILLAPSDVAVNSATGDIYIADVGNRAVRKVSGNTGVISSLNLPPSLYTGLGLDAANRLYVADFSGNQVLRESAAGSGSFAPMNAAPVSKPRDVAVDQNGNAYAPLSDSIASLNTERKIAQIAAAGAVSTLAGTVAGFDGDGGPAVNARIALSPPNIVIETLGAGNQLPATANIAVGAGGEVIFADSGNNRIRRIGAGSATSAKTGTITITGNNPVPVISRLSPTFAIIGRPFTLTVTGTGFTPGSKVRWNGGERATTYVSSVQLNAAIPATDLVNTGTANVTVISPAPGGGASNPVAITVSRITALPAVTSLNPTSVAVGTAFTLNVSGSNFDGGSIVRWNGQDRPTTYVSPQLLQADIPASDAQNAGSAAITVFTPEPGGGASNAVNFTITATNPVPALTSVAPVAFTVGAQQLTLIAQGSNFAVNSRVRWNGADRPTTFVDHTRLMAQLAPSDVASPGSANLTVFTPVPGGGVTTAIAVPVGPIATVVPAASFSGITLSAESIAALFGTGLATGVEVATSLPLPTTLGGTTVIVKDINGAERPAPLFFVSPAQINFLIPQGTAIGSATVLIRSGNNTAGVGSVIIGAVAPSLFTANANGQGVISGVVLRVKADGAQSFEPMAQFDQAQQRFVPAPIDLGEEGEQVFLILFGSGLRNRTALEAVRVRIGGLDAPVLFAGAAPGFVGLDQINLGPLPRGLAGRGVVDIVVTVDNRTANTTQAAIK